MNKLGGDTLSGTLPYLKYMPANLSQASLSSRTWGWKEGFKISQKADLGFSS